MYGSDDGGFERRETEIDFTPYDEPDCDDTALFCPNCERPNQFGELCPSCTREIELEANELGIDD